MRLSHLFAAALGLLILGPAHAADSLPLKRGIFVTDDVKCEDRSNATVLSFWGDRLNASRTLCVIKNRRQVGQTYTYDCAGGGAQGKQTVIVEGPTAFSVPHEPDYYRKTRTRYRWCSDAM